MKTGKLMAKIIPAILIACCFIATTAAAKITVGPMVQNGRTDGATITWESDQPRAATLTILKDGKLFRMFDIPASDAFKEIKTEPMIQNGRTDGATITWTWVSDQPRAETLTIDGKTYKTTDAPTSDAFKEIKIDGLQPGTVYGYEVRESGGSFAKGKFRTFPAGPEPFRFAGIGDTRSNFFIHKQLVDAIKKQKPAFVINTGDLVDDGTKPEDWPPFWKVVGPLVRNTYYYPAIGNHEKDSPIYYKYFSLPNNGGAEKYYSFTYGNVFVACLDFEQLYSGEQKSWLIKQLKATNADFKIVAVHVPFYSSSKREPNTGIRSIYVPVLKKYGVQLVLHGHDHFYERSVDSNGIQYVVTGGGGAPLYDFEREVPESKVRVKNYEYMIFDINGKQMDAKTIDVDGKVIDTFSITAK